MFPYHVSVSMCPHTLPVLSPCPFPVSPHLPGCILDPRPCPLHPHNLPAMSPLCPQVLLCYYPNLIKVVGTSEKVFEFLDQEEQVVPAGTLAPDVLQGHLQLEDVWFSYPEQQEPVLKVPMGTRQGT